MVLVTDSAVVQAALSTGRTRSKEIMFFMRRLFWLSVINNFEFKSVYIRSEDNIICDALSRLDDDTSNARLLNADRGGRLCCRESLRHRLYACRTGATTERAAEIPGASICAELCDHEGGTSSQISGLCWEF